jgi:hypothetical protein
MSFCCNRLAAHNPTQCVRLYATSELVYSNEASRITSAALVQSKLHTSKILTPMHTCAFCPHWRIFAHHMTEEHTYYFAPAHHPSSVLPGGGLELTLRRFIASRKTAAAIFTLRPVRLLYISQASYARAEYSSRSMKFDGGSCPDAKRSSNTLHTRI